MHKIEVRKPLYAVVLSLISTGLGHIYCGDFAKGLALFLGFTFSPVIVLLASKYSSTFMLIVMIASQLILIGTFCYAIIDSYRLAKRSGGKYTLKEYNKWYIYILFIVVALLYPANLTRSIRENVIEAYKIPSVDYQYEEMARTVVELVECGETADVKIKPELRFNR